MGGEQVASQALTGEALWFPVAGEPDMGHARRRIGALSGELGLSRDEVARLETIATELSTNLVRYAKQPAGLWWVPVGAAGRPAVAVVSVDGGPGIGDVETALADGASSASSLGVGLGGVKRFADDFAIHSRVARSLTNGATPAGTVVVARVGARAEGTYVLRRRLAGERACGDGAFSTEPTAAADRDVVAVVDGLGHGVEAAEAARAAVEFLGSVDGKPVDEVLRLIHHELRRTRGAAVSLVAVHEKELEWGGVGNVAGRTISDPSKHLVPRNGTLGLGTVMPRAERVARPHGGCLVLASDGISDRWATEDYRAAASAHPLALAALLMRDHGRSSDDATVLVRPL